MGLSMNQYRSSKYAQRLNDATQGEALGEFNGLYISMADGFQSHKSKTQSITCTYLYDNNDPYSLTHTHTHTCIVACVGVAVAHVAAHVAYDDLDDVGDVVANTAAAFVFADVAFVADAIVAVVIVAAASVVVVVVVAALDVAVRATDFAICI